VRAIGFVLVGRIGTSRQELKPQLLKNPLSGKINWIELPP
jgi:hypothetical protein